MHSPIAFLSPWRLKAGLLACLRAQTLAGTSSGVQALAARANEPPSHAPFTLAPEGWTPCMPAGANPGGNLVRSSGRRDGGRDWRVKGSNPSQTPPTASPVSIKRLRSSGAFRPCGGCRCAEAGVPDSNRIGIGVGRSRVTGADVPSASMAADGFHPRHEIRPAKMLNCGD